METFSKNSPQVGILAGLNRTMQYGNCSCGDKIYFGKGQFKSYYVVWKRYRLDREGASDYRLNRTMQYGNVYTNFLFSIFVFVFKSYYVVWKRHIFSSYSHGSAVWFKSYYVVWKLFHYTVFLFFFSSLNRTMQYGNLYCFFWSSPYLFV